jgi:hypothetical protein
MRKRLKNVYQCLVGGCTEHLVTKVVVIDHDGNNLFTLPTYICMCGWEPKLLDSKVVQVKMEHRVDLVELS